MFSSLEGSVHSKQFHLSERPVPTPMQANSFEMKYRIRDVLQGRDMSYTEKSPWCRQLKHKAETRQERCGKGKGKTMEKRKETRGKKENALHRFPARPNEWHSLCRVCHAGTSPRTATKPVLAFLHSVWEEPGHSSISRASKASDDPDSELNGRLKRIHLRYSQGVREEGGEVVIPSTPRQLTII